MRRSAVVLVAAAAVVAWSCGGDDDDAASTAPAATSGAVAPTTDAVAPTASAAPAEPSTSAGATSGGSTSPEPTTAAAPTSTAPPAPSGADPAVTMTEIGAVDGAPVDLAWRPDDDGLYVVDQDGRIQRIESGETTTALDITDLTEAEYEQGLLGLTFDPDGDLAYVNYTNADGNTTIAEYPVGPDGAFGDEARIVLVIEQPYENHQGGDLTFGPDGMLYIGMGDGGSSGDPERRASDPAELLGKMLRIDPTPSGGQQYTVPPDNPFVDVEGTAPEIWSSGLRNPWKFAFDRVTGDLWIADVGQNEFEEIDVAPAAAGGLDAGKGESFGWSALEGDAPFNEDVEIEDPVPPFFTYPHDGDSCSVTGGVRARGGPVADLVGWYVFGDYCSSRLWALEVIGDGADLTPGRRVDLGEVLSITAVVDGPDGEVYALSGYGPVFRLDPA